MARYTGPMTRKSRRLGVDLVGGDQSFGSAPTPRPARPRADQGERIPPAAAGEAEGPVHLRRAGSSSAGTTKRPCASPARPARTCCGSWKPGWTTWCTAPAWPRDPPDGPPAGQPRALHRQRREGRHPQLPGVAVRHRRRPDKSLATRPFQIARETSGTGRSRAGCRSSVSAAHPGAPAAGTGADRRAAAGAAHRRVLLK